MIIPAGRAILDELLPTGNRFVKKIPAHDVTGAEVPLSTNLCSVRASLLLFEYMPE